MADRKIPRHVAIIMDGNGRWAKARGLPRVEGHRAGVKGVRTVTEEAARRGISYLTLFAFSRENWRRPPAEVAALMRLLTLFLRKELPLLQKNGIRLRAIGRREDLPAGACKALAEVEEATAHNRRLNLTLALSYGGRDEIVEAARRAMRLALEGKLAPEELDEEGFSRLLSTADIPDPDLLIRTSGEMRLSNFLPWQSVYCEYWVTDTLWPDFTADTLDQALAAYSRRERRFGLTTEQMRGDG